MTAANFEVPLHIAIVGSGRAARHHFERLSLRDDCRVAVLRSALLESPFNERDCEAFFHEARDLEVVWICTPLAQRAALARAALAAGKHVVVDPPLSLTSSEAELVFEVAERAGRLVAVAPLRRGDGDFRTALALARSGKLGALNSARLIARQFVPPLASEPRDSVLLNFGSPVLDQLLQLVPGKVERLLAQLSRPQADKPDDGFCVLLQFESGASAHVEVSLNSLAPLNTGWILNGSQGGFAQGIHYRASEDGELIDVPLPPLPSDQNSFDTALIGHLCRGEPLTTSPHEARRVVALLEAIQQSAKSGGWVSVEMSRSDRYA